MRAVTTADKHKKSNSQRLSSRLAPLSLLLHFNSLSRSWVKPWIPLLSRGNKSKSEIFTAFQQKKQ